MAASVGTDADAVSTCAQRFSGRCKEHLKLAGLLIPKIRMPFCGDHVDPFVSVPGNPESP
jgi:hypothetical protein